MLCLLYTHHSFKVFPRNGFEILGQNFGKRARPTHYGMDNGKGLEVPKKFVPFPWKYHEELDVAIEDVSNLGMGIARVQLPESIPLIADSSSSNEQNIESTQSSNTGAQRNWVVMVPKVAPGEIVRVRIFRNSKTFSEADLISVLKPSPARVEPNCQYYNKCGGCQYQHITIEKQRELKRNQVVNVLRRIGKIANASELVNPVIGTQELYGYRAKLTPHYDIRKNGKAAEKDLIKIGFQEPSSHKIVDIEQCIIASPAINLKYKELREKVYFDWQQRNKTSKKNSGFTLLLREVDQGYIATNPRELVQQTVDNVTFRFKAGEFFQNNLFVLPLMIKHVIGQALKFQCNYLVDTYCGSGLFAISAASSFQKVYGIEVSREAIHSAQENGRINGLANVEFFNGTSEAIFAKISFLPSHQTVVVIDPPRKGCDETFLSQLVQFQPKAIVYVSCDPATQARDTLYLTQHSYRIVDVTPFDLFPQTRHIENVVTFEHFT